MIAVDGTEHAQRMITTVEAIATIYCREQETLHSVFTLIDGHVYIFKYCSQTGVALLHLRSVRSKDFKLSNIVIDEADHARIIDVNRRGCPMEWDLWQKKKQKRKLV